MPKTTIPGFANEDLLQSVKAELAPLRVAGQGVTIAELMQELNLSRPGARSVAERKIRAGEWKGTKMRNPGGGQSSTVYEEV